MTGLEENMKETLLLMTSEDGSGVGENLTLKKISRFRN